MAFASRVTYAEQDHSTIATPSHPNVLNRLHALFSSNSEAGPSRSRRPSVNTPTQDDLERALTEPAFQPDPPQAVKDRNALVIKLVTWNMGDALPKGDLAVLLGNVPDYQPLPVEDGLPIASVEDSHPYHLVIVAGQECPTESGVPRGLGGGLMKGMKRHGTHKKGKDKEKEGGSQSKFSKEEDEGDESSDSEHEGRPSYMEEETGNSSESAEASRAATPTMGHAPSLHRQAHPPGVKGWSSMLDEWLCGTSAKAKEIKEARKSLSPEATPAVQPISSFLDVGSPLMRRSSSAPVAIASPLPTGSSTISHSKSPLAQSPSSFLSNLSRSDSNSSISDMEASFPPPVLDKTPKSAEARRAVRPEIVIPADDPPRVMDGTKCYLHLTKQRLMGMYLSVYVHKDCRHLVSGVDKDFVTAGLAGGRLGNKGGIGISLKVADHRLLFVNSHLAAHTGRNEARMANIAKIKSELNLDCFLPKDDPRSSLKDLTDRFDSVFWCGDLNFRLDVARLHAEWLVEQKKYEEALTWDQLRNAMKDPKTNPFIGFEEGPICFPPTFKYDVWKSVKTTNKNLRRSLRRSNSISKRPADIATKQAGPSNALDHVPEADTEEHMDCDTLSRSSEEDIRTPDLSRRSVDSSRSAIDSAGSSNVRSGTSHSFDRQAELNGIANAQRPLEVKLKEKTKHLLQLVKIKTHLSPAHARSKRDSPAGSLGKKPSMELDRTSRRTSVSSLTSIRDSPDTPWEAKPFALADAALLSPIEPQKPTLERVGSNRRPSMASSFGSPQRPGRSFSLKRTMSGRSMRMNETEDVEEMDMRQDRREGVYDSSKKQRVPSWCDRVLWKAHPIPDVPEIDTTTIQRELGVDPDRPRFGRLSLAFSNLGAHLKSPITRTITIEPGPSSRSRTPPLIPLGNSNASPSLTLVDSTNPSPLRSASPTGQVPQPKAHFTLGAQTQSRSRAMTGDSAISTSSPVSPIRHPLLQTGGSQSGSPARPRITIDAASSPSTDRLSRPRANSESIPGVAGLRDKLATASPLSLHAPGAPGMPARRLTGEPAKAVHTDNLLYEPLPMRRETSGPLSLKHRSRTMTLHPDQSADRDDHRNTNAFARFFHDIPNWLHRNHQTAVAPDDEGTTRSVMEQQEIQRRHMKGEVVCLHYGTIDDAGMRQLEGRSDHRPAIFAAAIYI